MVKITVLKFSCLTLSSLHFIMRGKGKLKSFGAKQKRLDQKKQ